MTEAEFLKKVKEDVKEQVIIENRLNELNSASFLTQILNIREMYRLNKSLKFYKDHLNMLFLGYTFKLECEISKIRV